MSDLRKWLHLLVAGSLGAWSLMFLVFFIQIQLTGEAVIGVEPNNFIRSFEIGMTVTVFSLAMFAVWDILRRE